MPPFIAPPPVTGDIETYVENYLTANPPTVGDHNDIDARDAADAHPMAAVTGLVAALASKLERFEVDVIDGFAAMVMIPDEIDGTGDAFTFIYYLEGTAASGGVPEHWDVVGTFDEATVAGAVASNFPSGATVLVPGGDHVGLYTLTSDGTDLTFTATGTVGVVVEVVGSWTGIRIADGFVQIDPAVLIDPADIPYAGAGLFAGLLDLNSAVGQTEGTLDRWRFVSAFSTTNVDLTGLIAPATEVVTQPTLDGGVAPVEGAEVWLFAQTDPDENGAYAVHDTTGVWTKWEHPDVFEPLGNGYRVTCLAPGETIHGTTFMWLDDDRARFHRVSRSGLAPSPETDGPAYASADGAFVRLPTPSADLTTAP